MIKTIRVLNCTGDSAGGNLAAAVSLKLRDVHVNPQPKLQVLIYPVTQSLDFNLPSYIANENDVILNKEIMVAMWLMYASGNNLSSFFISFTNELSYSVVQKVKQSKNKSSSVTVLVVNFVS